MNKQEKEELAAKRTRRVLSRLRSLTTAADRAEKARSEAQQIASTISEDLTVLDLVGREIVLDPETVTFQTRRALRDYNLADRIKVGGREE